MEDIDFAKRLGEIRISGAHWSLFGDAIVDQLGPQNIKESWHPISPTGERLTSRNIRLLHKDFDPIEVSEKVPIYDCEIIPDDDGKTVTLTPPVRISN